MATEADQGSRKKRKRSAASSARTPLSQRDTVMSATCGSRIMQDSQTAVRLLFSACHPPVQMPDLPAELDAEQPPTLDDLLCIYHADSATAKDDSRAAADLPRDVVTRLIKYLEAVATYCASSRRGRALQIGSAMAAGPDSHPIPQESGEHAGAFLSGAAMLLTSHTHRR